MPINDSVGESGSNRRHDVQYVQALLNVAREDAGGAALDVDGKVGPLTLGAIREFQNIHLGFADGLVQPGKNTIKALEAQISGFFSEIKAVTALATVLSFEPAQVEPQPEEEPALSAAALQSLVRGISEG
jgi:peptidoglycan hydrolase-like protein with peptidoglycan-binding domain